MNLLDSDTLTLFTGGHPSDPGEPQPEGLPTGPEPEELDRLNLV